MGEIGQGEKKGGHKNQITGYFGYGILEGKGRKRGRKLRIKRGLGNECDQKT